MTLVVRTYTARKKANDAAKKIKAEGFPEDSVFVMTPKAGADVDAEVVAAVAAGRLPKAYAEMATISLREGRSILAVDAPPGQDLLATQIMESFVPVKSKEPEEPKPVEAKPVEAAKEAPKKNVKPRLTSEEWGIPLLWNGKSFLAHFFGGELASHNFYFFGAPKLKEDPAPLSSWSGLSLLSDDPTPLSTKIGKPVLTEKPYITGEPQLTSDPTPLSTKIGMKVFTDKPFVTGEPKLNTDPAPLSKWMGLKVLSDE